MLASQMNRTYVNLSKTLFQDEMVFMLTGEIAQHYQAIPIYRLGKVVTVGMFQEWLGVCGFSREQQDKLERIAKGGAR